MTIEDMSLLCDLDSGVMVDVFNNKLESFNKVNYVDIIFEAKNIEYQERFGLQGKYKVRAGDRKGATTRLHIVPVGGGEEKVMFPSRLRVVEIDVE